MLTRKERTEASHLSCYKSAVIIFGQLFRIRWVTGPSIIRCKAIKEKSYPFIFLLKNHQGMEKSQTQHLCFREPAQLASWQTNWETRIGPPGKQKMGSGARRSQTWVSLWRLNPWPTQCYLLLLQELAHLPGDFQPTERPFHSYRGTQWAETEMSLQVDCPQAGVTQI